MVRQFWSGIPLIPSTLTVKIFGMGKIFFSSFEFCFASFLVYINKLIGFLNARCFLGFNALMLSLFVVLLFAYSFASFLCLNKRQTFACNGDIRGLH